MKNLNDKIVRAVLSGNLDQVRELVQDALDEGHDVI